METKEFSFNVAGWFTSLENKFLLRGGIHGVSQHLLQPVPVGSDLTPALATEAQFIPIYLQSPTEPLHCCTAGKLIASLERAEISPQGACINQGNGLDDLLASFAI